MKEWEYRPPPDIDATLLESLRDFPRQPHMLVYALRSLAALLLRAWMKIYHRLEVVGRENLPQSGSFTIVCNHTSHLDTLALLTAIPLNKIHRTFPAAAADYFFSSLPSSAASAIVVNALPFDRKVKGAESLAVCSQLLANDGNILIIFPEGTRTKMGAMGRFRPGIGRLVVGTGLPVVPCHLAGGMQAWPKGRKLPRPGKLRLRIGVPQTFDHLKKDGKSVRAVCRELEGRVAELGKTHK